MERPKAGDVGVPSMGELAADRSRGDGAGGGVVHGGDGWSRVGVHEGRVRELLAAAPARGRAGASSYRRSDPWLGIG